MWGLKGQLSFLFGILLGLTFISLINSQYYGGSRPVYKLQNQRILLHNEAGKCLTVSEEFKLILEKCNYELEEPSIAGVFQIIKSNRGGHLMRWSTQPIPGAIQGCLQALPSKEGEVDDDHQELSLVECDVRDNRLNWEFSQVETAKHLLKKFPTGPCVTVKGHEEGTGIKTVPCDTKDPEQLWQICENVDHRKCDI